jgi:undecaprenol kinase
VNLPRKYTLYQPHKSLSYALSGIRLAFFREFNLVIQFVLGIISSAVSLYFGHWLFAFLNLLMMGIIISLELMNTAFETLCDLINLEFDNRIKSIKDIAAASVLISAIVWLSLLIFEAVVITMQLGII